LGIFWGKEMLPNFLLHFLFWGPPNFLIIFFSFFRLPNSLILFYFWLRIFPLFLASKFHYWFFLFVWLSNFLIFISCFQISLVFLKLASKFPFFFKKKLASFAPIIKFGLHMDLVLVLLGFLIHYFQQIFLI